jgi:hypothetical protein
MDEKPDISYVAVIERVIGILNWARKKGWIG